MIFCCMNHQKRNLTRLSKALEFPQFPHGVRNTVALQMRKGFKCVQGEHICYMFRKQKLKNHFQYITDTKNEAEELDKLHAAMKEKSVTASYTKKMQILTLLPDS